MAKLLSMKKTKAIMKNNAGEVEMSPFIETGYTTLQPKEVWHFPGKEFVVLSVKFRYVLTTG